MCSTRDPRVPPGSASLEGNRAQHPVTEPPAPTQAAGAGKKSVPFLCNQSSGRLNFFGGASAQPPNLQPRLPKASEELTWLFPPQLQQHGVSPLQNGTRTCGQRCPLLRRSMKNNQHLKAFATGGSSPGLIRISLAP